MSRFSNLIKGRRLDRVLPVVLFLIGSVLLGTYTFAPQTHIARPIHGLAIEANSTMINLKKLTMTLDVKSGVLSLYLQFGYVNATRDNGKNFSIVFVLPFLVQAFNAVPNYTPRIDQWKAINTNVTDLAASAVSAKSLVNSTNYYDEVVFYGEFIVAKTYADSHRGIYKVALPLDAGIDGMYFPNLQPFEKETGVECCQDPAETDVYLIIPESAINIQSFPSAKLTVFSRYYDNATLNSVEWYMTRRTQVSLSYVDDSEQFTYEVYAILGSLLLGAGISGIADQWREYSTEQSRDQALSRRNSSNTKNKFLLSLVSLFVAGVVVTLLRKKALREKTKGDEQVETHL